MDKVFKYFNDFVKGLTGLIMGLLTLGIVATFLFGSGFFGLDVVANIDSVLDIFNYSKWRKWWCFRLIGLLIVWSLISSK